MRLFTIASVTPAMLILFAAVWGGVWPILAVLYMTGWVFGLDHLLGRVQPNANPEEEFPAAKPLLALLGLLHLLLLGASVWSVSGGSGLPLGARILTGIAAGMFFGQISHPAGHELIHQSPRWLRFLGKLVYSTLLFGQHGSAHLHLHHAHVATPADPNTPLKGDTYYDYFPKAWIGSFIQGFNVERDRIVRSGRAGWRNPYLLYLGVSAATCIGAALITGWSGLVALFCLSFYAQVQILMSDYVQHYGLQRALLADGKYEPVGPQHSWNTPHWYSSAMMLNAPRHSDHHMVPTRAYPALQLDPDNMPVLPYSLPVMAGLALWPRRWRKVMDPRVAQWSKG